MPDYQKSKIYKLTCNDPDLIYYGGTTQKYLSSRYAVHKSKWKSGTNNTKSVLLFDAGNVKIELVEDCPCDSKEELNARERFYIDTNQCVNKSLPGRTKEEYYKDNFEANREERNRKNREYYHSNIEKERERSKKYLEKNRDKINEKITCECGVVINKRNIARHKLSKKHLFTII